MKSPELTATTAPSVLAAQVRDRPIGSKMHLVGGMLSPYRGWVTIILLAMLVETAMSLAAPWPLKVILDNVVGNHKAPEWLLPLRGFLLGGQITVFGAVVKPGLTDYCKWTENVECD